MAQIERNSPTSLARPRKPLALDELEAVADRGYFSSDEV